MRMWNRISNKLEFNRTVVRRKVEDGLYYIAAMYGVGFEEDIGYDWKAVWVGGPIGRVSQ